MKKFIALLAALTVMCQFSLAFAEDEVKESEPAVKTEVKAEAKTEESTEKKAEDKADAKAEDKSDEKAEDKADDKAEEKSDATTEDKAEVAAGDKTEEKTDESAAADEKTGESVPDSEKTDESAAEDKKDSSAAKADKEKSDTKAEKDSSSSVSADDLVKALLTEGKKELEAKKQEIKEYRNELKALFKRASKEMREKILEKIAEIKKEAGDLSIGTFVDGIDVDYEKYDSVLPLIKNGTTLVPVRAVTEAFNADVIWNGEDRTVTVKSGDTEIVLGIDSVKATVNGVETALSEAPEIIEGRTVVPVRFIAQALGMDVSWDDASRTVIIE